MAALSMQRRDWEQGILAQALLQSGQRERLIQLTKAAMVLQTTDGPMGVVGSGGPTDPAMGGAAYARAAEWADDAAMRQAVHRMLQWILLKHLVTLTACLSHLRRSPDVVRRNQWGASVSGGDGPLQQGDAPDRGLPEAAV